MSRVIETTVYPFNELSEKAKEKARDWYREGNCQDTYWAESTTDDLVHVAKLLGFDIATSKVGLMNGSTRDKPCIYWSGFSSQGDGACFEGDWSAKRLNVPDLHAYAPTDAVLHGICSHFADIAHAYPEATSTFKSSGRYSHSNTVSFECSPGEFAPDDRQEYETEQQYRDSVDEDEAKWRAAFDKLEPLLVQQSRRLMDWYYAALEAEYRYINEDAQVDEMILANEYEFTAEGRIV